MGVERRLELEADAVAHMYADATIQRLDDSEDSTAPGEARAVYKGFYVYDHPDPYACHLEPKGNAHV